MLLEKGFNFLGSLVTLAIVAMIFTSPRARGIIKEGASGVAGLFRAAEGR